MKKIGDDCVIAAKITQVRETDINLYKNISVVTRASGRNPEQLFNICIHTLETCMESPEQESKQTLDKSVKIF